MTFSEAKRNRRLQERKIRLEEKRKKYCGEVYTRICHKINCRDCPIRRNSLCSLKTRSDEDLQKLVAWSGLRMRHRLPRRP